MPALGSEHLMEQMPLGFRALMNVRILQRLRTAACGSAMVLAACADSEDAGWLGGRLAAAQPTLGASVELSSTNRGLLTQSTPMVLPGQVVRSKIGPASDSTAATRIATQVLSDRSNQRFRITLFVSVDHGFLIQMQPDPVTVGGGGLLWIEPDGRAQVLRRYR